jgi:phage baseplate assembly protein W
MAVNACPDGKNRMHIDFPFHFDTRGRTATTSDDDHIRDMIDQFLFTNPGERVNRPDFGSGLLRMVFELNSPELAAALQFTIQAGLQRWLGDVIEVQALEVSSEEASLRVLLQYVVRRTGERRTVALERSGMR